MAYIELPVAEDTPYQSFSVKLEGSIYQVRLRYNSRAGHWALDLADAVGAPLVSGIAIRLGVDLLVQYSGDDFPPGKLFAMNWVDEFVEPDRDNFGTDVSLIYEESE
jgi:hypothetical protein